MGRNSYTAADAYDEVMASLETGDGLEGYDDVTLIEVRGMRLAHEDGRRSGPVGQHHHDGARLLRRDPHGAARREPGIARTLPPVTRKIRRPRLSRRGHIAVIFTNEPS